MIDSRPDTPRRYRAGVAYDGTRYAGFQRQTGGTPTIQGELEQTIGRVSQQSVTVLGAGRTDSGVHATGQAEFRHRIVEHLLPLRIALGKLNKFQRRAILRGIENERSFSLCQSGTTRLRPWYGWPCAAAAPRARRGALHYSGASSIFNSPKGGEFHWLTRRTRPAAPAAPFN